MLSSKVKNIIKSLALTMAFYAIHYIAQLLMTIVSILGIASMDIINGTLKRGDAGGFIFQGKNASMNTIIVNYSLEASLPGMILTCIFLVAIYALVFKLGKSNFFRYIKFENASARKMLSGLAVGVTAYLPIAFIIASTFINDLSPETGKMFENLMYTSPFWLQLLGMGIFGPIIEEITFRGLIYRSLKKSMGYIPAVVIQGLLFGILHGNLQQFIYASVLGFIFGFICEWSDSIKPAIFAHIGFNSFSLLSDKLFTSIDSAFGEEVLGLVMTFAVFASFVMFVLLIYLFFKNRSNQTIVENNWT